MTTKENSHPDDEKLNPVTPPTHFTYVGSAEIVNSGQGTTININKASYQDFIAIHKFAFEQAQSQAGQRPQAGQHFQENTGIISAIPRNGAFISYSSTDERYLRELHAQLAYFAREGLVTYWDDTKIEPGKRWFDEIQDAIKAAKVAVFLASPEFLASEFIFREELPPLLHAASQNGTLIMSVILRPCAFHHTPLSKFQAVNPPSRPLSDMKTRGERDKVWLKLAECILKAQQPDS